jgi:hypothetical protein
MKFKLLQKTNTKFQILCGSDVVGSICVEPDEVAELLKSWSGPVEGSSSSKAQSRKQNPVVAAMMKAKAHIANRHAILRGC